MTLEENKKITLGLIEEYSPSNQYLTDDEDILNRLNLVYSTSYQELSQVKKILKTIVIKEIEDEKINEINYPEDLYQLKAIYGLDKDNNSVNISFKTIGKTIYLKDYDSDAKIILEYYAYPKIIKEDTPNDYELEIDQDVQMILPYAVANDILKADPSSDYTSFYAEYQRKLQALDTRRTQPTVIIEEGIL
jgi:hypothetical protein